MTNRKKQGLETESSSPVRKINAPRIVRALLCAAGLHDAWSQSNKWDGHVDVIRLTLKSAMHDDLQCGVCKHCRAIYVRNDGDSFKK